MKEPIDSDYFQYVKVIDKFVIHEKPLEFRELCRAILSPKTRYLILDLDRTFHLGRNIGELLGWEISAFYSYGPEYHILSGSRRRWGRLIFDWNHPLRIFLYFLRAAVLWAYPGLFYFFSMKIAWRFKRTQKILFRKMGPRAVERIQLIPLIALFHQMAGIPLQDLKKMVERIWERCRDDQVIFPEDISWVKNTYPGIKIIVSSASPQPCLEFVRDNFDVDDVLFTEIEEIQGRLSTPHLIDLRYMQLCRPRRNSPLGKLRHNYAYKKVSRLLEKYPDMARPAVETVGITDTKYGEDHAWAKVFNKVADLNSDAPFPPIISMSSPLYEIHSAMVLTFKERLKRENGQPDYWDERREVTIPCGRCSSYREEVVRQMAPHLLYVEMLEQRRQEKSEELDVQRQEIIRNRNDLTIAMEKTVAVYNSAQEKMQSLLLAQLRRYLRVMNTLDRRLASLERPLAEIQLYINNELALSRKLVVSSFY